MKGEPKLKFEPTSAYQRYALTHGQTGSGLLLLLLLLFLLSICIFFFFFRFVVVGTYLSFLCISIIHRPKINLPLNLRCFTTTSRTFESVQIATHPSCCHSNQNMYRLQRQQSTVSIFCVTAPLDDLPVKVHDGEVCTACMFAMY